ncbi:MAG: Rne/Rng family ribonuclease [Pseudomonadota bacterium]
MAKKMLIDATHPEETRVVVLDGSKLEDFDFESASKRQIAGNIYLAKVTRVEPSLQAAFVEYGGNRHGFLAFSEIHPDYYQIPKADRDALIAEEAEAAKKRAEAEAARDAEKAEQAEREAQAAATGAEEGSDGDAPEGLEIIEPVDEGELASEAPEAAPAETPAEIVEVAETPEDDETAAKPVEDAPVENPATVETAEPAIDDGAPIEPQTTQASGADDHAADPETPDADETGASKKPDSIAEATGADDNETVEEDYPAAGARKPDEDDAAGQSAAVEASAPRTEPAGAADDAAPSDAAEAEPPKAIEAKATEAEATTEDAGSDAQIAPEDEPDDDAESGSAESDESEKPDDGAEDVDGEDGRRRRRSRRGGRSRRSRRGRSRSDEDAEEGSGEAEPDGADKDDEAEAAPPRSRGRSRSRGRDKDRERDEDEVDVDAGDDMAEAISIRRIAQRRYKIQEVIKVRQILLVQVVKEERGNKGAALTTYLSLAGRYCVLMPNTARGGGISRKITSAADRKKLKEIASAFEVPQGMGLIVRTAGAKRSKSEIQRDYEYLLRAWAKIRDTTLKSAAPALIHEEGSLIKRVIRDMYSSDFDVIEVEGAQGWREAREYMGMLMPGHSRNVVLNRSDPPLFYKHGVEQELEQLFNPTVQLKSGGYIVIGVTEALVAIDINSGKSTKEGSIEDTALKTNLEASDEIARQLKLRDLAGLIVIDYIDMEEGRNNRAVEKRLKDRLKDDRARIQTGRISGFGLLEMSRQRLRPGMIEATTAPCPHCNGTGVVRSDASLGLTILRRLAFEASRGRSPELLVKAPLGAATFLFNEKREHLAEIEAGSGVSIRLEADPMLSSPKFEIEKSRTQTRAPAEAISTAAAEPVDEIEETVEITDRAAPSAPDEGTSVEAAPAREPTGRDVKPSPEDDDDAGNGRRRRGRRGGRRRRKNEDAEGAEARVGDEGAAADGAERDAASSEAVTASAAAISDAPAEIPEPRKTRRRRKRSTAEAEDAKAISAGEAPPEATESVAEQPTAPNETSEEPVEASPDKLIDETAETDGSDASSNEDALKSAEEPVEASAEPEVDASATQTSPAAELDSVDETPKPRKRGWWSR